MGDGAVAEVTFRDDAERTAWVQFMAAALGAGLPALPAAERADAALEQLRKRQP